MTEEAKKRLNDIKEFQDHCGSKNSDVAFLFSEISRRDEEIMELTLDVRKYRPYYEFPDPLGDELKQLRHLSARMAEALRPFVTYFNRELEEPIKPAKEEDNLLVVHWMQAKSALEEWERSQT